MDLPPEELQFLTLGSLLQQSVCIPKKSPKTFFVITLTLILPLSLAILAHSLCIPPLLSLNEDSDDYPTSRWTKLLFFHFCYLIFLLAFSLLSVSAVVFTVASLYTAKTVSFASTLSAIPRVFARLLLTFLWVSLSMALYNIVFLGFVLMILISLDTGNPILFSFIVISFFSLFFVVHTYFTAVWHLASVVSVLEPIYGLAALKKSFQLLQGKALMANALVFVYYVICGCVNVMFESMVGRNDDAVVAVRIVVFYGGLRGLFWKIVGGGVLVGVLVVVNFVGLLVQCVFYYVCKSYHHQGIDKSALYEQLGGYLGEYVPLKTTIQMHNLNV